MVMEEALRAGVERVVHTSSIGAVGPGAAARRGRRAHAFPPGLGVPYAESKHAAETEALRVAARGLDVVIVCPAHVFGRGDLGPTSTGVVRRFLLRRIPAYVPGAINVVDVADVAAGHLLADERGGPGERYILGDAQLHLGAAVRRARAALGGRGPGARAAGRASRSRWPRRARAARSGAGQPGRGARRRAVVDVQEHARRGASWAGRRGRTRTRSRRRCAGGRSGSASGCGARRGRSRAAWRLAAAARAAGEVGGRILP